MDTTLRQADFGYRGRGSMNAGTWEILDLFRINKLTDLTSRLTKRLDFVAAGVLYIFSWVFLFFASP